MPWSLPSSDDETRSRGSSPDRATEWEATIALVQDSIDRYNEEQYQAFLREEEIERDALRFEEERHRLRSQESEREIAEPVSR